MLHFIVAPALISLGGKGQRSARLVAQDVLLRIVLHPFIIATAIGLRRCGYAFSAADTAWQAD